MADNGNNGHRELPRMKQRYRTDVIPALMKEFSYKNVMQVPRLEKVVLNMGVGTAVQNPKDLDNAVRDLGLIDNIGALIAPNLVNAFGIFMLRQFFRTLPIELEEAARIDGANIYQAYWHIVLPLARPALITLTILSFQGVWNEFLMPLIVVRASPSHGTLPYSPGSKMRSLSRSIHHPIPYPVFGPDSPPYAAAMRSSCIRSIEACDSTW